MKVKVPALKDMVLIIVRTLLDNPNMVGGICERGLTASLVKVSCMRIGTGGDPS